jgi:hypothetical protein
MAKQLFSDGVTGRTAIFDPANPDAFANPRANLQSVYFHSDLDYVGVAKVIDVSITHVARAAGGASALTGYPQPSYPQGEVSPLTHGLGYKPFAIAFVNGQMLPANTQIQSAGMSFRTVALQITDTAVAVYETAWVYGTSLPAITIAYKIVLFTPPLVQSGDKTLEIKPSSFIASRGKLNTAYKYVRRDPVSPDFSLTKDKTADCSNGSFRIVTAQGDVIERAPYNGSFQGTPGIGVEF